MSEPGSRRHQRPDALRSTPPNRPRADQPPSRGKAVAPPAVIPPTQHKPPASDDDAADARLWESDRLASIGTLAVGLGHDMNNVLLPIRAHLNALAALHHEQHSEADTHIERILRGVQYLQQLADGLHYLALDPSGSPAATGSTNLHDWWQETGPLLSRAVPEHVCVTASIDRSLPAVALSRHALTQIALNLIVNAGESIPPGRKRRQGWVRISAMFSEPGREIQLCVSDNGRGMDEATRSRAFDMFFTTKPRGLGTGLGLALVRRIVEQAGAEVAVESAPGKGTVVRVMLPIAPQALERVSNTCAVVTLADRRAAALTMGLISATGARAEAGTHPGSADIWVLEPKINYLDIAKQWHDGARRSLVLFGLPKPPQRRAWEALGPVTVQRPDDVRELRTVLGQTIASISGGIF